MLTAQGLAWAAAWLHSATGEQQFLADAHDYLVATQAFEGEKCAARPLHVSADARDLAGVRQAAGGRQSVPMPTHVSPPQ